MARAGVTDPANTCPKCGENLKWIKKVGACINGMWERCTNLECGYEKSKSGAVIDLSDDSGRAR